MPTKTPKELIKIRRLTRGTFPAEVILLGGEGERAYVTVRTSNGPLTLRRNWLPGSDQWTPGQRVRIGGRTSADQDRDRLRIMVDGMSAAVFDLSAAEFEPVDG